MAYTQTNRPMRLYTPLGDDVLLLEGITGTERISRPFEYTLDMLSENDSVSLTALIRKPVHVEIDLVDGNQRIIHGRVSNFAQRGRKQVLTSYQMTVRPWLWFLSLWTDCKIFQNKSVTDIVEQVFTDHHFTDFSLDLVKSYAPRDYCVQYRETGFDFVNRLLEEEGIYYYFEHSTSAHKMILSDAPSKYKYCPDQKSARFAVGASSQAEDDVVIDLQCNTRAVSGQVTLNDYNFITPSTSLKANATDSFPEEIYDYPGDYEDRTGGERLASLRLEERETPATMVTGRSSCRGLIAGYKFDLKNHYRRDLNQAYLITGLSLSMTSNAYTTNAKVREDYTNAFETIPASVTYRPERITTTPVISGVQTALVVGPSGEEIYSDKYGRVKVQFNWDRDGKKNENSSCWLRVSQDWAGKNWGSVFIPRMGQEVIVEFLEGDPDRPIITGRVYNAEQMPPYALPDNQTQSGVKSRSSKGGSSSNYNEFRFEDKMGSELVLLHAEKDLTTEVEHDENRSVGNDRTTKIANNETKTVDQGNETITLNQGNQSTTIKMGNQSTKLNMGNQDTKLDLGAVTTEAMQSITLKVGQSSIVIDQMGVTIKGMMIKIDGQIQVQVHGLMVQVNADAMLQLQGAITMIN
ncbi:MAG TPA: type VI secretion system tip protein VgrG [Bryobacteraceae bacterium]|nr:type VI secretion system tip protein VgrG [Bryobacteraceae bacterium]